MNPLEKEFAPYQESLELKELGFDEPCFGRYYYKESYPMLNPKSKETELVFELGQYLKQTEVTILAPTFSQAFRWFREKCFLFGYPFPNDYQNYGYRIVEMTSDENKELVYDWGTKDTYEEAELACLRKLIEIVKNYG